MRRLAWSLWLISALSLFQACRESEVNSGRDRLKEAVSGVNTGDVAKLDDEIRRLQSVVDRLQRDLAEARVKIDLAELAGLEAEKAKVGQAVKAVSAQGLQVVDVDRDMKVSVINGGAGSGIRAGMSFHVLRDDRVIARLKIVDVREQIAGGLIEDLEDELFPEKGDRVVLSTKQD